MSPSAEFVYGVRTFTPADLKKFPKQSIALPNPNKDESAIYRVATSVDEIQSSYPTIKTVYEGFQAALESNPNGNCLGYRPALGFTQSKDGSATEIKWGGYVWQTYRQISERRINFGCGIIKIFREIVSEEIDNAGKWKIGIFSVNRPEWALTEFAANAFSLITVPLYETLGPDVVEFVTNHSELSVIVCSIDKIAGLLQMHNKLPSLKIIVSMDSLDEGGLAVAGKKSTPPGSVLRQWAAERGIKLASFNEVESLGQANRIPLRPPKADDVITVCYTSGTTGNPKGALMTHGNIVSVSRACLCSCLQIHKHDVYVSYLPLAHIMERSTFTNSLIAGAALGFSRGDVTLLLEDIAMLRPTIFVSVPRLLNRIYDRVCAQTLNGPSAFRATLFRTALDAKSAHMKATGSLQHPFWDALVFNKVKALLGGRVRFILSGSAPISPEVLSFLRACFGCYVVEGYGQTESSASIAVSWMGDLAPGIVGPPFANNEIKLVSIPEMSYTTQDKPYPRGEIWVRGANVFKGYLKDEVKTKETLTEDGWLKTGDVGMIDDFGRLSVIDRKKNIFKLAQGEYVAPEKIENVYLKSPLIAQIFVHGDSLQSELVAIVVPDFEVAIPEAKKRGWLPASIPDPLPGVIVDKSIRDDLVKHPGFRSLVATDIDRLGKEAKLQGFEMVKAVRFEVDMFTAENGMLTPTFKVKRAEALAKYRSEVDEMYSELAAKKNAMPLKAKL